jgi:hypothetical protein
MRFAVVKAPLKNDRSPAINVERRPSQLPKDLFFDWMSHAVESAQMDSLFLRQSFTGSFAAFALFHFVFQARIAILPNVFLFEDRRMLCLPDSINARPCVPHLPLTDQFQH